MSKIGARLHDVAYEVWQDFILLDPLAVVTNLLLHNALLVLETERLRPHNLRVT